MLPPQAVLFVFMFIFLVSTLLLFISVYYITISTLFLFISAALPGVLFEALREACAAESQISERFGVEVSELDQAQTGVVLRNSSGSTIETQPYDLVVIFVMV